MDIEKREDERGYFARNFCLQELAQNGIEFNVVQGNMSMSHQKGTFRGLHYQSDGKEAKVFRCIKGSIFDVVIDLRPDSPSYLEVALNELSETNQRSLYIPPGCAHGFLTLQPESMVNYMVSASYNPSVEKGIRYNDPLLADVTWPVPIQVVSMKDLDLPDYKSSI